MASPRVRRVAARSGQLSRGAARRVRRATNAQGAGESGLAKLIELHAVNAAADAAIAVSLAGTLFFSVPVGEARNKVALYLLITMAPFAVMAPVIGPVLDRLGHGRRYAIAATFALRGVLALVIAGAVNGGGLRLYPAAFGLLLCSKSYGVLRASTVPRLLPPQVSLVKANSRTSLAGIIAASAAVPVAGGLAWFGVEWSLRFATLLLCVAAVLALRLPRRVDSAAGELRASLSADQPDSPRLRSVGPAVVLGLRANAALRGFSGYLTLFLAFLLRQDPVGGLDDTVAIGLVVGAAAAGGFAGTTVGAWLRARPPEALVLGVLALAAVASVVSAWLYGLVTVLVVAAAAGFAQALGKLALDALIQRDIRERVRTSAFARSETLLQLSWVVGGGVGIALPLRGDVGLGVAAVVLAAMLVVTIRGYVRLRRGGRTARARATPVEDPNPG